MAELHRKIGAALAHKGERKQAIEHHQMGINLIKDGEPSLALVRLYEEAAWLYMQTGDNMLAIYASEKALRLAEQLGEVRAASRAHGIFGRVFGRIGDTAKARENLERAVELARGSDAHETVLALLALGHHLESSDGDYAARRRRLCRGAGAGAADRRRAGRDRAPRGGRAAGAARGDWEQVERSSDASAELSEREGLVGKLCLPNALRGRLHWRERRLARSRALPSAARTSWPSRSAGRRSASTRCTGSSATLRDRGDLDGAEARSRRRSRSATAPG